MPPTARSMRRIERISGRSDDMLIIRGVNVFPSNIETVLAKQPELAPHYLLELHRPGSLDELDIIVETRIPLHGADMTGLEQRAQQAIKAAAGVTSRVRVVAPGTLERSQGKAKRVIDLRPKD